MRSSQQPVVVKLGGSLAETGRLAHVLAIVATARTPLVIAPGGGPFADLVRAEQARLGFSDGVAHGMALLAMHQMGLMLAAREARLRSAETVDEMREAWAADKTPLWLPYRMATADPALPKNWSITSDGLAAWLAERIGAGGVVLVKSCRVDLRATARTLAEAGVVDPWFASAVERSGMAWTVLGDSDEAGLREAISAM